MNAQTTFFRRLTSRTKAPARRLPSACFSLAAAGADTVTLPDMLIGVTQAFLSSP
jgi:flagella basal body P-ring formation protein FlgA